MTNKRIRNKKVEFFVTEEEFDIINKKAKESSLDRSKYLRKVSLNQSIVNIDLSYLNKLIYELNKIGININQIAKNTNSNNFVYNSELKEVERLMKRIWELISETL